MGKSHCDLKTKVFLSGLSPVLLLAPNKGKDYFCTLPIFENLGGGLKACPSQNKSKHFFEDHLVFRATLSILLQVSKGEDFFGDLLFEKYFFAYFWKFIKGRADNIVGGTLTSPGFMVMVHSKGQCRKSARPLLIFLRNKPEKLFF